MRGALVIRRGAAAVMLAAVLAAPAAGCGSGAPTTTETAAYVRIGAATLSQLAAIVAELLDAIDAAKAHPPACDTVE